jgi:hypothetical protein
MEDRHFLGFSHTESQLCSIQIFHDLPFERVVIEIEPTKKRKTVSPKNYHYYLLLPYDTGSANPSRIKFPPTLLQFQIPSLSPPSSSSKMSDNKLRCALVYRLEGGGKALCVAKYDHAGQYETHGGADSSLYGGRDKSYAEAVAGVISNDPPSGLSQSGALGGFKVVQSDQHQVVYGADTDGLCKFAASPSRCFAHTLVSVVM